MKRRAILWSLLPSLIGAGIVLGLLFLSQTSQPVDDIVLSRWFRWRGGALPKTSVAVSVVRLRTSREAAHRQSRADLLGLLEGLAELPPSARPRAVVVDIALLAPAARNQACLEGLQDPLPQGLDRCLLPLEASLTEAMAALGTVVVPYQLGFKKPDPKSPQPISSLHPHSIALTGDVSEIGMTARWVTLPHPDLEQALFENAASAGHVNISSTDKAGSLGLFNIPLLIEMSEPAPVVSLTDPEAMAALPPPRLYPSLALAGAAVASCGPGPIEDCIRLDAGELLLLNAVGEERARVALDFPINYRPALSDLFSSPDLGVGGSPPEAGQRLPALLTFQPDLAGGQLEGYTYEACWRLDVASPTLGSQLGPPPTNCTSEPPDLSSNVLVVVDYREHASVTNPLGAALPPGGAHAQIISNLLSNDLLRPVKPAIVILTLFILLSLSAFGRLIIHRPKGRLAERLVLGPGLLKARGLLMTPEPWLGVIWIVVSYGLLREMSIWLPVTKATLGLMGGAIGWRLSLPFRLQREATRAAALLEQLDEKRAELAELRAALADRLEEESRLRTDLTAASAQAHRLDEEIVALQARRRELEEGQQHLTADAKAERESLTERIEELAARSQVFEGEAELLRAEQRMAEEALLGEIDAALEGRPPAANPEALSPELIKTLGLNGEAVTAIQQALQSSRETARELEMLRQRAAASTPAGETLTLAIALKGRWSRTINNSFLALEGAAEALSALGGLFEVRQRGGNATADIKYLRERGIHTQDVEYAAELRRCLESFSSRNKVIYIQGERGTGKSMLASVIHKESSRTGEFETFDAGMEKENPQLIAAHLAGYWKGAFNGANRATPGVLERCDGGTVFIDEVAELPPNVQSMLLKTLSSGEVTPLGNAPPGEARSRKVDVRFLIATNRDLSALAKLGEFREDLYDRLAELKITLRPPRERPGDIPLLVAKFLAEHTANRRPGDTPPPVHPLVLTCLKSWHWPGNVRSIKSFLENLADTAWFRSRREGGDAVVIEPSDLTQTLRDVPYDPRSASQKDVQPPPASELGKVDDARVFGKVRVRRLQIYRRHNFQWCEDATLQLGVKFSNSVKRPAEATFYYDRKRCFVDALLEARGDAREASGLLLRGASDATAAQRLAQDAAAWHYLLMAKVKALEVDLFDPKWEETESGRDLKAWLSKELKEQRAERRAIELARLTLSEGWGECS